MTRQTVTKITEKTLVPLTLVFSICGGIIWLTTMFLQSNANAKSITEIKETLVGRNDAILVELRSINTRLSRIEGKLDRKEK